MVDLMGLQNLQNLLEYIFQDKDHLVILKDGGAVEVMLNHPF
jgi:hypothetical protein